MTPDRIASPRMRGALALAAALSFAVLSGRGLDRPGLYYDEAHQAAGAFAYVGKPTRFFAQAHVGELPLLNMPYSGAIKTFVYGVWLRVSGEGFDLRTWRVLGLLFGALGVAVVVYGATASCSTRAAALFATLVASDGGLLLCCRHDWGPVALAFLLRAAFLGLWFLDDAAGEAGRPAKPRTTFLLAALVGFSIYEKLSNLALLGPFALALFATPRRRGGRHLRAAVLGWLLGAAPLLVVNAHSLIANGDLVSARDARSDAVGLGGSGRGVLATLSVGAGADAAARIFADDSSGADSAILGVRRAYAILGGVEAIFAAAALLLSFVVAKRRGAPLLSSAAARAALAWGAVAAALELLPGAVDVHHRVVATPFAALALARAFDDLRTTGRARAVAGGVACAWVLARVVGAAVFVVALTIGADAARGDRAFAPLWRPSLDAACRAAAALPPDVLIVTPDWGVSVPIYCYADGAPERVRDLRRRYGGVEDLRRVLDKGEFRSCVVFAAPEPTGVGDPARFDAVLSDLAALGWRPVPLDLAPRTSARVARFDRP